MTILEEVLGASKEWTDSFDRPMKLGVKKKLVILTCMDYRIHPERILGLKIGDAEVIQNAGGRVTADVFRSLMVCIFLLDCDTILVIHHSDCGGQAVVHRHPELISKAETALSKGSLVPRIAFDELVDPIRDLEGSVLDDLERLRNSSIIPKHVQIHGLVYDSLQGSLKLLKDG